MTLDISSDYLIFDNVETITFQNKGESPVTIGNVMRRPSVLGLDTGGGNLVYGAAVEFLIWKENIAPILMLDGNGEYLSYGDELEFLSAGGSGFVPKLNATITDVTGKKYTVDLVDDGVLRTRWSVKATSYAGEGVN